ncbi:tRNA pseudouridine synthase B [Kordiimonas sediminis]|uniref:tRNA pseudouridine synthase B n=1 Tax=Kordiimonas sediminis TaxID=1735581 RepID=A0A919E600_9PROT|nr:tRNA pseudouridine(55) synthase TruB [Kordiimonas sediminis]GHF16357.1 tRNA pseudouridine synthase B [Kordiimonas sediminis]
MGRRRKGDKVDGWLVIDKPLHMSSSQVVGKVRRITQAQKAGHGGTLDPLASGILPVGLGEATKTMPFIVDSTKVYTFRVAWGTATDSDDCEGEVVADGGRVPEKQEIEDILPSFMGEIGQVPPAYSAIKVDGQRAYALARAGKTVELQERIVQIHNLRHVGYDRSEGWSDFEVTCGKGTYVRSLARDIALGLGTFGHVSILRRTRVGPFSEKDAISLEKLEELGHSAPAAAYILPVMTALDDIPALAISEEDAIRIKHGGSILGAADRPGTVVLTDGATPIAIAEALEDGTIKPVRVFNM